MFNMGKVKQWAWDSASKFLENIQLDIEKGILTKSEALAKMQNSDEALYLEGINNADDAEEFVDSIGGINLRQV
tara:strand:+ start:1577 stop:1798 length:222 start_codon:yes stop_codon:yes gene_type:complete